MFSVYFKPEVAHVKRLGFGLVQHTQNRDTPISNGGVSGIGSVGLERFAQDHGFHQIAQAGAGLLHARGDGF